MKDIVQMISTLEDLRFTRPASREQIIVAENELGVTFAEDYIKYVEKFGAISARGIEITGVTTHERMNVVSVTNRERSMNSRIPSNMYVIENNAIDGIITLQDETGKIYTIAPYANPKLVFDSLTEYVENSTF